MVPIPVAGAPKTLQLLDNDSSVLFLPIPNPLEKRISPQISASLALILAELLFDLGLGRNTRMVSPWQPEYFLALHPGTASKNVLDRVVENVAKMKNPRHIRRRNDDGVGLAIAGFISTKATLVDPAGMPLGLHFTRVIAFG